MGKKFLIVFALFFTLNVYSQKTLDLSYAYVDSITYAQYLQEDWESLINVGLKSKQAGIDFYYLKVRMGIAYFNQDKMLTAVKIFEDAYELNNFDLVVQEYLYWSYRYSGLIMESQLFYKRMSKQIQDKIRLKLPIVSSINMDALFSNNSTYKDLIQNRNAENDGYRYFPKNFNNYGFGLNHPVAHNVNIYHRLNLIYANSTQQVTFDGETNNDSYSINEIRYYVDATLAIRNKWSIDFYSNYISGKYEDVNDTLRQDEEVVFVGYSNGVIGLSLNKSFIYWRNSINFSISNLNGLRQYQGGYLISFYPFQNIQLVPYFSIQGHHQNNKTNAIYSVGISYNSSIFSIEGYGSFGEMENFVALNGSVIYNQPATTKRELGVNIYGRIKKVIVKAGYSIMNMEDNFFTFDNVSSETYQFNQQNLTGSLIWQF